ncbi:MAG: hypothetical protein Kow0037_20110 [Calditrichia bacterium]
MKPKRSTVQQAITLTILAAVVALFIIHLIRPLPVSILAGGLYLLLVTCGYLVIRRWLLTKIGIFTDLQQWLIRTVLYTTLLAAAYLLVLLLVWFNTTPWPVIREMLTQQIHESFLALVTWPLNPLKENSWLTGRFQQMLIPVFLMIFAIAGFSLLVSFLELRWQQNRQALALQQAELTALRAQMDSHFLFNTLNTIISQVRINPELAERLLIQLSDLLRYLFRRNRKSRVPLRDEIHFARQYLSLANARYGERLQVTWQVECGDCRQPVPSFILQPILENSLKYGWRENQEPLSLNIAIKESQSRLEITISDNGPGIPETVLQNFPRKGHSLFNIRQRLLWLYGRNFRLNFQNRPGGGLTVNISIPREEA